METEINGGCFKLQRLLVFYFFYSSRIKLMQFVKMFLLPFLSLLEFNGALYPHFHL